MPDLPITANTNLVSVMATAILRKAAIPIAAYLATKGVVSGDQTQALVSMLVGAGIWALDLAIAWLKSRKLAALALNPAVPQVQPAGG